MIYFVTPAWQRYELTAVCLEQRKRVIERLEGQGIEARCVVIANDENLDIARGLGFDVVEQNNKWLGRKFNDGMQYAGKHGADWIVPIGSDSWIEASYFTPLPDNALTVTSAMYTVVESERMAMLKVGNRGAGPYMFHRSLLGPRFRPAVDKIKRHVDSSTVAGIRKPIDWHHRDLHPLQYIGFRGNPHITSYERLKKVWGVSESTDPWAKLARHYPKDLVERAHAALAA
jgi:hypothetical protein